MTPTSSNDCDSVDVGRTLGLHASTLRRLYAPYLVATGVWSLVHRRSFERVTGPKEDYWLVQTVGALAIAIGASLGVAVRRRAQEPETIVLGPRVALRSGSRVSAHPRPNPVFTSATPSWRSRSSLHGSSLFSRGSHSWPTRRPSGGRASADGPPRRDLSPSLGRPVSTADIERSQRTVDVHPSLDSQVPPDPRPPELPPEDPRFAQRARDVVAAWAAAARHRTGN